MKIMIKYKYNKKENKFTENGHTMFEEDVLKRLKRLAYLEEQIKHGKLNQPTIISCVKYQLPLDNSYKLLRTKV